MDWRTAMHIAQAERIMELEVRKLPPGPGAKRTFTAYDGDTVIATVTEHGEKWALTRLMCVVYSLRSSQTRREQSHRCFSCAALKPTEIDHIIMRSHDRCDARWNLRAVCHECHAKRHLHGAVLEPHPMILKSVAQYGWKWGGDRWVRVEEHE